MNIPIDFWNGISTRQSNYSNHAGFTSNHKTKKSTRVYKPLYQKLLNHQQTFQIFKDQDQTINLRAVSAQVKSRIEVNSTIDEPIFSDTEFQKHTLSIKKAIQQTESKLWPKKNNKQSINSTLVQTKNMTTPDIHQTPTNIDNNKNQKQQLSKFQQNKMKFKSLIAHLSNYKVNKFGQIEYFDNKKINLSYQIPEHAPEIVQQQNFIKKIQNFKKYNDYQLQDLFNQSDVVNLTLSPQDGHNFPHFFNNQFIKDKSFSKSPLKSPQKESQIEDEISQFIKIKELFTIKESQIDNQKPPKSNLQKKIVDLSPKKKKKKSKSISNNKGMRLKTAIVQIYYKIKTMKLALDQIKDAISKKIYQRPGSFIFFKAVRKNQIEFVQDFINQNRYYCFDYDEEYCTALHRCCQRGFNKIAVILLKNGSLPDCKDNHNLKPLYYAIQQKNTSLVRILLYFNANPWSDEFNILQGEGDIRKYLKLARRINISIRSSPFRSRDLLFAGMRELLLKEIDKKWFD